MLKELDSARFNFCLQTGRRFYVACKLIEKYTELLDVSDSTSLNGISGLTSNRNFNEDIRFNSCHSGDGFDPFDIYSDPDEGTPSEVYELFSIFDSDFFINIYTNINYYQFSRKYRRMYSPTVMKAFYAASLCIVPIEINNRNCSVKCNYGPDRKLKEDRLPLIDCLYRSNEMIDFANKLISSIMLSTHLYYWIYSYIGSEQIRSENSFADEFRRFNTTWNSKIMDLRKCFSLYRV